MYKQCKQFYDKDNRRCNKHNRNTLNCILTHEDNTINQSTVNNNQDHYTNNHIQWRRQLANTAADTAHNRSDYRTSEKTSGFDTSDNTEIGTDHPSISHNCQCCCTIMIQIPIHLHQLANTNTQGNCHCNHHHQCNLCKDSVPPCQTNTVVATLHTC